jgi:putative Mn2+ efflux pump MntP
MLQTIILAFSLSTDAFAASVAKGTKFPRMSLLRIAWIALGFGTLEALAPLIGYLLGLQFAGAIENYDHWVAFIILAFLGLRMVWKSFHAEEEEATDGNPTFLVVIATAVGTSVDAAAVGITLALFSNNIPLTLLIIGFVTFFMTLIGLRLGGVIGEKTGQWAELAGGVGLFAIGTKILLSHLFA